MESNTLGSKLSLFSRSAVVKEIAALFSYKVGMIGTAVRVENVKQCFSAGAHCNGFRRGKLRASAKISVHANKYQLTMAALLEFLVILEISAGR